MSLALERARRNRSEGGAAPGAAKHPLPGHPLPGHGANATGAAGQSGVVRRFFDKLGAKIKAKREEKRADAATTTVTNATVVAVKLASEEEPVVWEEGPKGCNKLENTEMWGDLVKWGSTNKKDSWQECCEDCRTTTSPLGVPCNVWVYCGTDPRTRRRPGPSSRCASSPDDRRACPSRPAGDEERCGAQYRDCWLKHDKTSNKWSGPKIQDEGPEVAWTSGAADSARWRTYDHETPTGRKFHVIITSSMSVYQQVRARAPSAACPPLARRPRRGGGP